ncbi:hypothetical protein PMAYCL1PPCAC_04222, partial [Pristionchus mayeri]
LYLRASHNLRLASAYALLRILRNREETLSFHPATHCTCGNVRHDFPHYLRCRNSDPLLSRDGRLEGGWHLQHLQLRHRRCLHDSRVVGVLPTICYRCLDEDQSSGGKKRRR